MLDLLDNGPLLLQLFGVEPKDVCRVAAIAEPGAVRVELTRLVDGEEETLLLNEPLQMVLPPVEA